ncbi:MAG: hypothetical protein WBM40_02595, partial [Thiohalocapsa sp.]
LDAAREALQGAPGVVVLEWQEGSRIAARLLLDPLADDPAALVTDADVLSRLDIEQRPYVAVDPPIVLRRAARRLAPPEGVRLKLQQGVLQVTGLAPVQWIERLKSAPVLPAGVDALDLSALEPDHSDLLARVEAAIDPPAGVVVRLDGTALALSGIAPWRWIDALPMRLAGVAGLGGCDAGALGVAEVQAARDLAAELGQVEIRFAEAANPLPGSKAVMDRAALLIKELERLDAAAPIGVHIDVVGHSDGVGAQPWNHWLRQQRADVVVRQLVERGAPERLLNGRAERRFEPSAVARPAQRRVSLRAGFEPVQPAPCNPLSAS